jgi:predicted metal-dependent hydrolase
MNGEKTIPFSIGEECFQVHIRRRKHQKHIRIRISGSGTITVSGPLSTTAREIRRAVETKKEWILSHLSRIEVDLRETDPRNAVFLKGEKIPVTYRTVPGRIRSSVSYDLERACLTVTGPGSSGNEFLAALRSWLEKEARRELKALASEISEELSIPFRRIFIRNQRSRWGSSSGGGNISLNWRVVMLPPKVQRYLVIHELCHQLHLNHSKKYWKEVERCCPDYLSLDRALRDNHRLMALFRSDD